MSDGGDWHRRGPYGNEPDPQQPPERSAGGRRRRSSDGSQDQGGYAPDESAPRAYGYDAAPQAYPAAAPAADPYAADPYGQSSGQSSQGYGQPPQGYAQPQFPQGYGAQAYDARGYGAPQQPPAEEPPPAASYGGRRAAPRGGPKVVQSEVLDSSSGYGRAAHQQDPYQQPRDPYGRAANEPVDDGWGDTSGSHGYADQYDDGYGRGNQGRGGGRGDDGWDDHNGGGGPWGDDDDDYLEDKPRRRGKLRAWAPLIVLLVVLGGFGGCIYGGYSYYKSKFGPAPDYTATACTVTSKNKVSVEVPPGASQGKVAAVLFDAGVIKSTKAYVTAANNNQASQGMQAGSYLVCKSISADTAVSQLLMSANRDDNSRINVIPGEWKSEVFASLATKRKWDPAKIAAAEKDPSIGLPSWAGGNVEGFLEPGQYELSSTDTPATVLGRMVKARTDFLTSSGFVQKAGQLICGPGGVKCTPYQALIIASMAEAEVKSQSEDSGVAEAVIARLKGNDFLGIDATTVYGLGVKGKAPSTGQTSDASDPYSTGGRKGLPPGPIGNPADETITAILTPTHQGWYYWCAKPGSDGSTTFYLKSQLNKQQSDCGLTPAKKK